MNLGLWLCSLTTFPPLAPHCDPCFVPTCVAVVVMVGEGLFSHRAHSVCPLAFSGRLLFPFIVLSSRTRLPPPSPAILCPPFTAHTISLQSIPPTCTLISFPPRCLGPALSLPARVPTWASPWASGLGEVGPPAEGAVLGFRSDLGLSPAPKKAHVLRRDIRWCTHPPDPIPPPGNQKPPAHRPAHGARYQHNLEFQVYKSFGGGGGGT